MFGCGVFVGRMSPIHLGHEAIIRKMIEDVGVSNSCLVLGSSNAPMSFRNFFSYEERRSLIKKIFPDIGIVGIPDYPTDSEWLLALDDILKFAAQPYSDNIVFYGGCEEDIRFFIETGREVRLLNRFDGTTPKISATEVRDALSKGRSLDGFLNPVILEDIRRMFLRKWEVFKRT